MLAWALLAACLGAGERERVTASPESPAPPPGQAVPEPEERMGGAPAQAAAMAEGAAAEKAQKTVADAIEAGKAEQANAAIPAAATATIADPDTGDEETITEEPVPPGEDAKKITTSKRPPQWGEGPKKGEPIFGVGMVKGVANPALARRAAADRAREDLDRRLVAAKKKKKGAPLKGAGITLVHYDRKAKAHYARADLIDVAP